ncbi:type II toxin-antitoxin system RelE/ParE family toxin [Aliarcobacter cryaerophilus]|uniref:type II toxin-antitoxin system RelE/ParE family toxin n=1 Tax=Aliarcobacter cryaerophilus TaxID=28198 RepID=UPI0021B3635C|nr:type II toxin-antitoxin system RelE/ParE family toxin [Aliarcobacter cryaerophilus]MCT7508623.1 type II toxin-antitoxin system RelE/ParE family toxin [Aliarcobacter cryaerophilus]
MQIIRDKVYINNLDTIIDFIAQDSLNKAINFLNELDHKIHNLTTMPYKFRSSYYYNNENVRDLIFKGYTIPYLVNSKNNTIVILDIFKWVNR